MHALNHRASMTPTMPLMFEHFKTLEGLLAKYKNIVKHVEEVSEMGLDQLAKTQMCNLIDLFHTHMGKDHSQLLKRLWDCYLIKGEDMLVDFIVKNFDLQ